MKNKIKITFSFLRSIPVLIGYNWKSQKCNMDLQRWKKIYNLNSSDKVAIGWLLYNKKEYRNLLIYRNRKRILYRNVIKLCYKPMNTLFIEAAEIGGGLFIQHGFATMISATSIGENCWINQQVTIGYRDNTEPPKIGNNVMITCGAKVLGNISVGDDVVVGANAVVIKDVEQGAVVGGIPAKNIK